MTYIEQSESQPKTKKKLSLKKKILFVALTIILMLVTVVTVAYWKYVYPTGEIMPGLYAVRNYRNNTMVNFFIMKAGEKYIAIDSGADNEQTMRALQRLGIETDDIIAVFLTHSDWDHIEGLHLFHNATIYLWNAEYRYVETARIPVPPFEIPDIPHHTVADGEIIELYGRSIQCIYTPGHTSDSVSFLVDGTYLFVGDLLTPANPNRTRHSAELQILSREQALGIEGVEYVFNGHFGFFKNVGFFRWQYGN